MLNRDDHRGEQSGSGQVKLKKGITGCFRMSGPVDGRSLMGFCKMKVKMKYIGQNELLPPQQYS